MEEILQDPAKFEELLKERETQKVNVLKKIASPIPSRKSERIQSSDRVEPMTALVKADIETVKLPRGRRWRNSIQTFPSSA